MREVSWGCFSLYWPQQLQGSGSHGEYESEGAWSFRPLPLVMWRRDCRGCLEAESQRQTGAGSRHLGGTGARPQPLGTGDVAAEAGCWAHRAALFSDPTGAFGFMHFSAKQTLSFRFQGSRPWLLGSIYCLKNISGTQEKGP